MGLFSGLLGKGTGGALDISVAVMLPMVAAVMADGEAGDDEIRQIRSICAWSPIYARNTMDEDTQIIQRAARIYVDSGAQSACERARDALSPALRETAFIFAVRLVFSDGHIGQGERTFIEQLAGWLALDAARARMLVEAVSIMQHQADA